jgi:putative transcriptional regulator
MSMSTVAKRTLWQKDALLATIREMEDRRRAQGRGLFALRKSRSWSQEEAAHQVGVSVSTWGDWERGKHDPYDRHWQKIEEVFGIDASQIRGEPPAALFPVGEPGKSQLDRIERQLAELQKLVAGQATLIQQQEMFHRMMEELAAVLEGQAVSRAVSAAKQTPGQDPDCEVSWGGT